ncbi:MAG TPA: carboxypeptidase-like regulatory domain-containing protein [Salegentibacter sp.]|nr:carboxypeptidase-like regulatory domain-containing protein [Salegentibacter sp.]
MKKIIYFVILLAFPTYGQEITGYLYDSEGRIPNFSIWNASQQLNSSTDQNGYFELPAVPGDTVIFNSISYEKYEFRVENKHLEADIVVELKENSLDEVEIISNKRKGKSIENLDKELSDKLQADIKRNPELYTPSKGNILNLIHYAIKLFKKDRDKEKYSPKDVKLSFSELQLLFEKDELLNGKFLSEELHIPEQYHKLFLEHLASKKLSSSYLEEQRKLDLINMVYIAGAEYQEILKPASGGKD